MARNRITYEDMQLVDANLFMQCTTYASKALLDVDSALWGNDEAGYWSYCTLEKKYYVWNGSANQEVPVIGGTGAPTSASYVTINSEPLLDAETMHQNIPIENVHICKLHHETHEDAGTDEISVTGLSGLLADEQDAGWIKGHLINDTGFAIGRVLGVNPSSQIGYLDTSSLGDMLKSIYDENDDGTVDAADDADTVDSLHSSDLALAIHKNNHVTGADKFVVTDNLDCNSRVQVQKNSVEYPVGKRRTLNFIEGSGVTLTIADSSAQERVNITVACTAESEWGVMNTNWKKGNATGTSPITVAHGMSGIVDKDDVSVQLGVNAVQPNITAVWDVDATNLYIRHSAVGSVTVSYLISKI